MKILKYERINTINPTHYVLIIEDTVAQTKTIVTSSIMLNLQLQYTSYAFPSIKEITYDSVFMNVYDFNSVKPTLIFLSTKWKKVRAYVKSYSQIL